MQRFASAMRWEVPDCWIKARDGQTRRATKADWERLLDLIGRGDRIRTYDPLRPRQVRYQAALRPDKKCSSYSKLL